jgi:hypothetical protein
LRYSTADLRGGAGVFLDEYDAPEVEGHHVVVGVHALGLGDVAGGVGVLVGLQGADGGHGPGEALHERVPGVADVGRVAVHGVPVQVDVDAVVAPVGAAAVGQDGLVGGDLLQGEETCVEEYRGQVGVDGGDGAVCDLLLGEAGDG